MWCKKYIFIDGSASITPQYCFKNCSIVLHELLLQSGTRYQVVEQKLLKMNLSLYNKDHIYCKVSIFCL